MKDKLDENKESSDEEESDDNINETTHGQPVQNLSIFHFNSETETEASEGSETITYIQNEVRDDEMVTFDNTNVKLLQNIHFQSKVIKFGLGCIPRFDKEISEMKNLRTHFRQY